MKKNAVFVFSEDQLGYKFSDTHPFNQKRLSLTVDLLKEMNALIFIGYCGTKNCHR